MNKTLKERMPRAGVLLVASPRFKNLSGPKRGTYGERKEIAVRDILGSMDFLDPVFPGIVWAATGVALLAVARVCYQKDYDKNHQI